MKMSTQIVSDTNSRQQNSFLKNKDAGSRDSVMMRLNISPT